MHPQKSIRQDPAERPALATLTLLVDRILIFGALQFDDDLLLRLRDLVVLTKGLKTRRDHLDAQLAIGYSLVAGLAVGIGLQLQSSFRLLTGLVHRVQHDAGVANGLAVGILEDYEVQRSMLFRGGTHRKTARQYDNKKTGPISLHRVCAILAEDMPFSG